MNLKVALMTLAMLGCTDTVQAHCFSEKAPQDPSLQATCYKGELSALAQSDNNEIREKTNALLKGLADEQAALNTAQAKLADTTKQLEDNRKLLETNKQAVKDAENKITASFEAQENDAANLSLQKNKLVTACQQAGKYLVAHKYGYNWQLATNPLSKLVLFIRYHTGL